MNTWQIIEGNAAVKVRGLPDKSVQAVITSPPYWQKRNYGVRRQWGLEKDPDRYIAKLIDLFDRIKPKLRDDATLWINLGSTYSSGRPGKNEEWRDNDVTDKVDPSWAFYHGFPRKSLVPIPHMLSVAMAHEGWIFRSEIIWHKTNPMPESVNDRPVVAHEHILLFSKNESYYYGDIRKPVSARTKTVYGTQRKMRTAAENCFSSNLHKTQKYRGPAKDGKGARETSVWSMGNEASPDGHTATFPLKVAERMILNAAPPGATILDPFSGLGTTGLAAIKHQRNFIGIEINSEYANSARNRLAQASMFAREVS